MSEELARVKESLSALEHAYTDAGGTLAADRDHCSCPFCHDETGFSIRLSKKSGKPQWQCHSKCGQAHPGTIVDFLMKREGIDCREACKRAIAKYGGGAKQQQPIHTLTPQSIDGKGASPLNKGEGNTAHPHQLGEGNKPKKEGKLHQNPDLAVDAVLWGIRQDKKDPGAQFVKRWNYTNEKSEPVFTVARFNLSNGKKEVKPIRRDGNGWRSGLGEWGTPAKLMPLYRLHTLRKAITDEKEKRTKAIQSPSHSAGA